MAEKFRRKLNLWIISFTKKYLFKILKACGMFPFNYNQSSEQFSFITGFQLIYTVCIVGFQVVSTCLLMGLKIYNASILSASASRELAQLFFLISILTYQTSVLLLIWNLYTKRSRYLSILNDINLTRLSLARNLGILWFEDGVDHHFEFFFSGIFLVSALFTGSGLIFYISTLFKDNMLKGFFLLEALSLIVVAPSITFGFLFYSAGNLFIAHLLVVIRFKVQEWINRVAARAALDDRKMEKRSGFEFEQLCLEISDQLNMVAQLQEQLHQSVHDLLALVGTSLAMALLNIFLLVVSNVSYSKEVSVTYPD